MAFAFTAVSMKGQDMTRTGQLIGKSKENYVRLDFHS